ncbi:unnamed protein product, partial [Ectocarpus fasciculatus]
YEPRQGSITLDGVDIATLNPSWLRRQVRISTGPTYCCVSKAVGRRYSLFVFVGCLCSDSCVLVSHGRYCFVSMVHVHCLFQCDVISPKDRGRGPRAGAFCGKHRGQHPLRRAVG